jgi:UDP-3-O-acyl N-acetylglucosamine deacetylase
MFNTIDARSLFTGKRVGTSFRDQNTLAQSVDLTGFGFWTGKDASIQFRPAPPNNGIVFVRSDLAGNPHIPALIGNREEKPRQTSLVCRGARVDMVEHVLAALYGLQIDNCEIWTNQPEMPGFDGSSQVFVSALDEAGIVAQPAKRAVRVVTRAFYIGSKHSYIIVTTSRRGNSEWQYTLIPEANYPLQTQRHQIELSPKNFRDELAMTRTFISKREADALLEQGICQRVTPQNVLLLSKEGPVENNFLYENECARHKTLDMVGDFALLGCDLIGTFESFRGGHSLNAECVQQLLDKTMLIDPATETVSCHGQDCFREAA